MKPALLILAAGLGSRYGGMKQLQPMGPGGATIMDYSIYDALRAGFGKIVFVVRPGMEATLQAALGRRWSERVPVAYAIQRLDALPAGFDVPPGRTKPWGTGHALLAAEDAVQGPLAVVNADDFYGVRAFTAVSDFLQRPADAPVPTCALVGYALRNTLTEAGAVSRAICRCTPDGWLEDIVETVGIEKHGADGKYTDDTGAPQFVTGDTLVCMNMWGLGPGVFEQLRGGFQRFLHEHNASSKAEFRLPSAVRDLIHGGSTT